MRTPTLPAWTRPAAWTTTPTTTRFRARPASSRRSPSSACWPWRRRSPCASCAPELPRSLPLFPDPGLGRGLFVFGTSVAMFLSRYGSRQKFSFMAPPERATWNFHQRGERQMKRQLFAILMVLTLVATGAAFAQSGSGGGAAGSTTGTGSTGPGGSAGSSNLQNETEPANGPDVDVDTGNRANGAVDVDVNRNGDADTDASGVDETGGLDRDTTNTAGDNSDLPGTASELPAVALLGLLAMAAAFTVRFFRS